MSPSNIARHFPIRQTTNKRLDFLFLQEGRVSFVMDILPFQRPALGSRTEPDNAKF